MKTVHLHLDLEDTVITPAIGGFQTTSYLHGNIEKIKNLIKDACVTHLHIFSFAINNEKDLDGFNTYIRRDLEMFFGMKIDFVPMTDYVLDECKKETNITVADFQDMVAFWGKSIAFQLFMFKNSDNFEHDDVECIHHFVDNSVMSVDVLYLSRVDKISTQLSIRNIEDLK